MNKKQEDTLWDEIYNLDGFGLMDYLNEFHETDRYDCTRYGEKVFADAIVEWYDEECLDYDIIEPSFEFNRWSEWRYECSYYFNGLLAAVKDMNSGLPEPLSFDEIRDILVFGICRVMGLVNDDAIPPKHYALFLFC